MNGGQDLGGMMGFGAVVAEPDEPVFHAEWEKRVLALRNAAGALGEWNIDMARHANETLHPVDYLSSSYYEVWLKGLEKLLIARGLATPEELAAGRALQPAKPSRPPLAAEAVTEALAKGTPYDRPPAFPARFAVGEEVRALNINPKGHTRLPRYARGKRGRVEKVHGVFVFPDANAHGLGPSPQWLYLRQILGRGTLGPRRRSGPRRVDRRLGELSRRNCRVIPRSAVLEAGDALLPIARESEGPIFNEAWEAEAFAMVVALHEAKLFSWSEWTAALGREIAAASQSGDRDPAIPIIFVGWRRWSASSSTRAPPAVQRSSCGRRPGRARRRRRRTGSRSCSPTIRSWNSPLNPRRDSRASCN